MTVKSLQSIACVWMLLGQLTYIPRMLSKSRFNRRLHAVAGLLIYLFQVVGEVFKQLNAH